MDIELLTKFAEYMSNQVTETNRPIIADFLEKFLVVEIKKIEGPSDQDLLKPDPVVYVAPTVEVPEAPARSGNGHKILKKRDLDDHERDSIKGFFLDHNGQIEDDICVGFKKTMHEDVAIFQVVGFVSYCHRLVAMGKLVVGNTDTYIEFLKAHRNLWATYNSPRYRGLRARLGMEVS